MNLRLFTLIVSMTMLWGCASLRKNLEDQRLETLQRKRLDAAVELIEKGNRERAVSILAEVVNGPGFAGITDEALFRLGLLSIPSSTEEREEIKQALKLLDRLQREYPTSSWATQAAPLTEFLSKVPQTTTELRRQIKTLRDLNLSLTRENKEMRLNIEKLKALDLELEKKSKPQQ